MKLKGVFWLDNENILITIYKFYELVRKKNSIFASAINKAILPLVKFKKPLQTLSRDDLFKFNGIGPKTATFIKRIIDGEDIYKLAEEIHKIKRKSYSRSNQIRENYEWNGSWDNIVKIIEGD